MRIGKKGSSFGAGSGIISSFGNMKEIPFESIRSLGSGASGSVELCRLLVPLGGLPAGSEVAVKILAPELREDPLAREAFAAEAEVGRRVEDPSLVRVLAHGLGDDGPYLVLQYVPGRSLREILEEGPLPEPLVRSVGAQLASALAALHEAGVAHGDVKPENIRLDDEGRAVLLDLGFSVRFRGAGAQEESPQNAGSLAYLSPERARGGPASAEADVFALGVVLYEIVCGIHPFGHVAERSGTSVPRALFGMPSSGGALVRRSIEEPGADNLLAAITAGRCELPSRIVPQIAPFLDAILTEILQRTPANRPAARRLARDLTEAESGEWWRAHVDRRARGGARASHVRERRWIVPLIGRDEELARLARAWEEVRGAEDEPAGSAAVVVEGGAGCGKWRLVNEFVARVRETGDSPLYLYARCSAASEARPAGALLLLLHRWLRLPPGVAPGEREEAQMEDMVVRWEARTLLAALGLPEERDRPDSVPAALARWLTALGRHRPLIVFLDDLQRAGAVTLDTISVLLAGLQDTRILLVCGIRDDVEAMQPALLAGVRHHLERLAETATSPSFHRLVVGPLEEGAMRDLVDGVFHPSAPRVRLAEVLWSRSLGNPALITEILRDLLEHGAARARSDADARLVLEISPGEIPRPRSTNRIVTERLARLEPGERLWLERIAVVGTRIGPEFLMRAFSPTGRAEIDAVLSALVRGNWLVGGATRYRFERPALREAVLRTLSPDRRRRLHRAAARGLAPREGESPTPDARFQRARHLRAAGEHRELVDEVRSLLGEVRRRASARRLYTLARWGLEALEQIDFMRGIDRLRIELLEVAADAADRLGNRSDQRVLLDHLSDHHLDAEQQPAEAARLYVLHGRYAAGTGQLGLARGMLRNAVQLAEASGRPVLSSEASRRLSQVQGQIGEFEEAREHADRALVTAVGPNQRALALLTIALLDVLEDRFEPALRQVDAALSTLRGRESARLGVVGQAHLMRARIWRTAGRPRRALGAAARAVRLARRAGERVLACEARARLGTLLADLDHPEEAETQLRDAMLVAEEIEDRRTEVLGGIMLGTLLWESGDETARPSVERGTRLAGEIGFHRAEAVGLAILSRMDFLAGELALADEKSGRAVKLVDRHGAELVDRIAIEGTRALVLRGIGHLNDENALVRRLRRRVRRSGRAISSERLRRAQETYTARLLDAVLSPEGHVLPRSPAPVDRGVLP